MGFFIAIPIPEDVTPKLQEVMAQFNEFSLYSLHTYHITLEFLGDIKDEELRFIQKRLASFSFPKFTCTISKLGVFPGLSSPRVIWVSSSDSRELLLFSKLVHKLETHLFREIRTDFKPHISLARIKDLRNKQKLIQQITKTAFIPFSFLVEKIILYKSQVIEEHSTYIELSSIPLD